MRRGEKTARRSGLLSNLTGLLLASLACIAILTAAIATGSAPAIGELTLRHLAVLAVLIGAYAFIVVAMVVLVRAVRATRRFERQAGEEVAALRHRLHAAQAILAAEPSALISWERVNAPQVLINNLAATPEASGSLLRFGEWIDAAGSRELHEALEALFERGQAFNLLLRTRAGIDIEADGRVAGRRAILRFRDVAGGREKLAGLSEQRRQLASEIETNRKLFDSLPMLISFRGSDRRLEWVNKAYVEAVRAGSLNRVIAEQVEFLEERQRQTIAAAVSQGSAHRERMHVIANGERRAWDVMSVPLGTQLATFAVDASILETTESKLTRQMAAHDRTLDRVATAVAIFGRDRRLGFFNEAYKRLWQLDRAWLASGPRDGEILDRLRELGRLPLEADYNYKSWKTALLDACRKNHEFEDSWHLADGSTLHVIAEQRPDGGITYLFDDVTERLALERGLKEMSDVQRETLDHLQEGVAVFAPDGRLRLFNPAFARIWKLSPGELDKAPHVDEVIRRCRALFEDGRAWTRVKRSVTAIRDSRQRIEGQMNRPDRSVISYAGLPLPDGATLLTFLDISDRKRVELALIERNEALEAADRLKSDFISHVSYELRTPLTNIIGFCELLSRPRTGTLNTKQGEYLRDIHASSNTLQTIINDILDLATIDAGTFELSLAPVSVRAVVEQASDAIRERLSRARTKLDVRFGSDIENLVADGSRVSHVLYNLLSNAIGFSEPGGTIRLTCANEDGMIAFRVEDEGCGIPFDQQGAIFERFESRAMSGKHRGAGLGLAIVKSLVELHGGDVALTSEPGRGTTVIARFPANGASRNESGDRNPGPAGDKGEQSGGAPKSGATEAA